MLCMYFAPSVVCFYLNVGIDWRLIIYPGTRHKQIVHIAHQIFTSPLIIAMISIVNWNWPSKTEVEHIPFRVTLHATGLADPLINLDRYETVSVLGPPTHQNRSPDLVMSCHSLSMLIVCPIRSGYHSTAARCHLVDQLDDGPGRDVDRLEQRARCWFSVDWPGWPRLPNNLSLICLMVFFFS